MERKEAATESAQLSTVAREIRMLHLSGAKRQMKPGTASGMELGRPAPRQK